MQTVAANEYVENMFHRTTNYVSVLECIVTAVVVRNPKYVKIIYALMFNI